MYFKTVFRTTVAVTSSTNKSGIITHHLELLGAWIWILKYSNALNDFLLGRHSTIPTHHHLGIQQANSLSSAEDSHQDSSVAKPAVYSLHKLLSWLHTKMYCPKSQRLGSIFTCTSLYTAILFTKQSKKRNILKCNTNIYFNKQCRKEKSELGSPPEYQPHRTRMFLWGS